MRGSLSSTFIMAVGGGQIEISSDVALGGNLKYMCPGEEAERGEESLV